MNELGWPEDVLPNNDPTIIEVVRHYLDNGDDNGTQSRPK